jgi:hypothetical protein
LLTAARMTRIVSCLAGFALLALGCAQGTGYVEGGKGSPPSGSGSGSSGGGGGGGSAQLQAAGYQPSQAVAYADANWDDGVGLCAQFTSDSLIAGNLSIQEITYVPTLLSALSGITYEEHTQGDDPSAAGGDVVIYSDATGDSFCDDGPDEYNCGHACLVAQGGQGEDTITVDCHNNAHYHLALGYILGGGYSTYRIYHLSSSAPPGTVACTTDADCNQGQAGTQDVCASGEDYCIQGCHSDFDCPSGLTCEQTSPHWSCQ